SVALARELEDPTMLAESLFWLASNRVHLGDAHAARTLAEESLAVWRRSEEPRGVPAAARTLATLAWRLGNYARATPLHEEVLSYARKVGDAFEIARIHAY